MRDEMTIRLRLAQLVKRHEEAIRQGDFRAEWYFDSKIFELRWALDEVGD